MDVEEDSVMEGLNGTESNSQEESTEPNGDPSSLNPADLAPTSLKDAAPTGSDPAISPSPPQVGSRTLPGVASDEMMDANTPISEQSDLEDEADELTKPLKKVEVVITQPADPSLPYASKRTGLVYDPRMRFHAELNTDEDDIHPEDPRRIWEIYRELVNGGLVDEEETPVDYTKHPFKLWRIPIRLAEPSEIALVHDSQLYDWVDSLAGTSLTAELQWFFETN